MMMPLTLAQDPTALFEAVQPEPATRVDSRRSGLALVLLSLLVLAIPLASVLVTASVALRILD